MTGVQTCALPICWIYSDQQRLAEFEGMAIESNVVSWVLGKAKVSDKPIAFDELMGRGN